MPRVLRLTVLTGPHRNQKFCLCGNVQCMMGRASGCQIRLDGTERDQFISRLHCLFTLDAESLTVRDLHSTSGTYLDGKRIESAVLALPPGDACLAQAVDFDQGQLLNIGGTTFRLDLVDCPPKGKQAPWQDGETIKTDCPLHCA